MRNLVVIPARCGSKGLVDKNIKLLNGRPLLSYTIDAAIHSGIFNEIYVSTDSEKYAQIAIQLGAKVPFMRSKENADDYASSWDVVKEALKKYKEAGQQFDMVTLLQPTSPLRTAGNIIEAYDYYLKNKANAVIAVCEAEHSPLWSNTLPEDNSMTQFINWDIVDQARQKLAKYYRLNGAIYMINVSYLSQCKNIYESDSIAYVMSKENSIDIDDEYDFMFAEAIMKSRMNSKQ